MMQETLLSGTARKAGLPGWQAAGKTGTSQDYRDAWFIGYTGRVLGAVWIGFDDPATKLGKQGGAIWEQRPVPSACGCSAYRGCRAPWRGP